MSQGRNNIKIGNYFKMNKNENASYENLWDVIPQTSFLPWF